MTKNFYKEIKVSTYLRVEFKDITTQINNLVKESKIITGLCYVYVPHTTAGLTINEHADSSVVKDILRKINDLVPEDEFYSHLEGNSDSHIKTTLMGNSLTIFVTENKLKIGCWQGIYFCEFDGPRDREVWVKIVSD